MCGEPKSLRPAFALPLQANLHRESIALDHVLDRFQEDFGGFPRCAQQAYALRLPAKIAWSKSSQRRNAWSSGGRHATANPSSLERACTGRPECSRAPASRRQATGKFEARAAEKDWNRKGPQRQDPAARRAPPFPVGPLPAQSGTDGDRLALAELVLENAQGLIEGIDQKIHNPVANRLTLGFNVGRGGQRAAPAMFAATISARDSWSSPRT